MRRENFTRDKCTLPTIPLGPAEGRQGPSDDDDDANRYCQDDDDDDGCKSACTKISFDIPD